MKLPTISLSHLRHTLSFLPTYNTEIFYLIVVFIEIAVKISTILKLWIVSSKQVHSSVRFVLTVTEAQTEALYPVHVTSPRYTDHYVLVKGNEFC